MFTPLQAKVNMRSNIPEGEKGMAKLVIPSAMQASYDNFHFAPAQIENGVLYASGQLGTGPDGKIPESAEDEFRLAWQSVGAILQEAGLDFSNIFEFTSYHVGLQANLGTFMKVKDEFIKQPYPAWTAIGVSELAVPGARVEIRVRGKVA